MSRGVKVGIIATVVAGMVGVAGYGAYNIYNDLNGGGGGGSGGHTAATSVTAPLTPEEVSDTATDFLTAWSTGDVASAAELTDSPQTATTGLTAYRTQTHVTAATIQPHAAVATKMSFTVDATLTYPGLPATPWQYTSELTVGRNPQGKPAVTWAPSVLYPGLENGQQLVTGPAETPELDIVDRNGKVMDPASYPSLTGMFQDLRKRYAAQIKGGTPGIETFIEAADGSTVKTLDILRKGTNAKLKTTLDSTIQAAAEQAVKKSAQSAGVTALDTRTGGILAVAFNPPTGQDLALDSLQAPGSTFKIVTATALLNSGMTPGSSSPCHSGDNVNNGKPYTNTSGDNAGATLQWDFEHSCNTGFIKQVGHISSTTLSQTGSRYFGLGPTWYVGTGTLDGKIPDGTGDDLTSAMIGQGTVQMTTLNMASVSATVREGTFHQPSLLQDKSLIDKRTSISTSRLPSGVDQDLQQMMHGTVTEGTAQQAMSGVTGKVGAKTGSAEAGNVQPNGWFTAYRDHVSAAAMVLQGGHGGDSAGPIVAAVLRAS